MTTFLDHHRRAMSVQRDRRSMTRELSVGRDTSRAMSVQPRDMRASSITRDYRATSMTRDTATRDFSATSTTRDVRDIRSMSRDIRASVAREFEAATRDFLSTHDTKDVSQVVTPPANNVTTPTVAKET